MRSLVWEDRPTNADYELAGMRDPGGLQLCLMLAWENLIDAALDRQYWLQSIKRSPVINRCLDERLRRVKKAEAALQFVNQ